MQHNFSKSFLSKHPRRKYVSNFITIRSVVFRYCGQLVRDEANESADLAFILIDLMVKLIKTTFTRIQFPRFLKKKNFKNLNFH